MVIFLDVDCGGNVCPGRCVLGKACNVNADCFQSICIAGSCFHYPPKYNVSQTNALYSTPGVPTPIMDANMRASYAAASGNVLSFASINVTAGNYVRINAQSWQECNDDNDVTFVIFTIGPTTPNGLMDLAMVNHPSRIVTLW